MKVALILNANLYCSPYAKIYSKILEDMKIDFDFIAWDRTNTGETGGLFYNKSFPYGKGRKLTWFVNYFGYSTFVKKLVRKNKYDKLVIFGPQVGFFLYMFLRRNFNKKFAFDYRDIFIDQKAPKLFGRLLKMSAMNSISSPGFNPYLPKGVEYVQSHNFDIDILKKGLADTESTDSTFKRPITILTIGSIRDFDENYQVMSSLRNNPDYHIRFIGRPDKDGEKLKSYSVTDEQTNVEFIGFFKDEDQKNIISEADFINIFRPTKVKCSSTFTNRFYYALIYRKPMLVTKGSIEGSYVEKYNLGLALDDCTQLDEKIKKYISEFNYEKFSDNCKELLQLFHSDYDIFKQRFTEFISD